MIRTCGRGGSLRFHALSSNEAKPIFTATGKEPGTEKARKRGVILTCLVAQINCIDSAERGGLFF